MALLEETLAAITKAEVETEVVAEVVGRAGEGGVAVAVAILGGAKVAVEVGRWVEVAVVEDPHVVALVDVVGATLVSGKRAFERLMILGSRRKGTGWSPGSTLPKTTHPNSLFVRFSNPTHFRVLTTSFRRSWLGDNRPTRRSASQLFCCSLAQEAHLRLCGQDNARHWITHQETDLPTPGATPKDIPPRTLHRSR